MCLPRIMPESNFGMTKRKFIDKIEIPASNIHRIRGEEDPENEASDTQMRFLIYSGT